jgi:hypothetical protein
VGTDTPLAPAWSSGGTRDEGPRNDPGGCIRPFESCHQPTGAWTYLKMTTASSFSSRHRVTDSDMAGTTTTWANLPG